MKIISVIIPTYNRELYIKDSISSVLTQQLPKGYSLEILVIDDGSTDSTEEIIKQFKDKVIYKQIKNSGRPAVPRNIGLKMASGDLVAFQDSDDLWVPNKLINQLPAFDDPDVILSYGNAKIMDADGKLSSKTVIKLDEGKSGSIFEDLVITNFISTLTVMARKSELIAAGGFDESAHLVGVEDYELWLRMATLGKFMFVPSNLAFYRRHDANVSLNVKHHANEHILSVYKSLLNHSLSRKDKKTVRRQIVNIYTLNSENASALKFLAILIKTTWQKILIKT
jgi:glycosyltransferase involved in cell wall biosynthesis